MGEKNQNKSDIADPYREVNDNVLNQDLYIETVQCKICGLIWETTRYATKLSWTLTHFRQPNPSENTEDCLSRTSFNVVWSARLWILARLTLNLPNQSLPMIFWAVTTRSDRSFSHQSYSTCILIVPSIGIHSPV